MLKRPAARSLVALATVLAPATAQADDVVRPSSTAAAMVVPAGGTSVLTLRCPGSAVALNAAVTRQGSGLTLRRSVPGRDAGSWRLRLAAAEGASERRVRAVLRCVRLELAGGVSSARLVVRTRHRSGISIPAGAPTAFRLGCGGRRWLATGYGLQSGEHRQVRIAEAVPTAHGWEFRLENTGVRAAVVRMSVRCLRRSVHATRRGDAVTLGFRIGRVAHRDTLGPGSASTVSHRCPRNRFSVATGSALDWRDTAELAGSHPLHARAGRWSFARTAPGTEAATFLLCLARGSRFR